MLVKLTIQGFDNWSAEIDVEADTTVAAIKKVLKAPPHSIDITTKTKVLWRRNNNCLMGLLDTERVRSNIVLLNAVPKVLSLTFPPNFVWGSATAAYQIEGAAEDGGRRPSIWDTFAAVPGNIDNGDSAKVACDHYARFEEDVRLMKALGLPAYRFSISWCRLIPEGRGEVNAEAVIFYRSLLEMLVEHKIQPMVTLYHWDMPQALEDKYGGWLSRRVVGDFEEYAVACFEAFGDLVKLWLTLNEPWCSAVLGYASGEHAPGRKEAPLEEPYTAAHHMILAHARAVRRYRGEFRAKQHGRIGITLNMDWKEPLSDSEADTAAQARALAWQLGWFAEPIYRGQYPSVMRARCRERLPTFTEDEVKLVKGSSDFFGLNHYSTDYVSPDPKPQPKNFFEDSEVRNSSDPNWAKSGSGWDVVPWGLQRLVTRIHRDYAPTGGIVITENGYAVHEEDAEGAENDTARMNYLMGYLAQLHKAIEEGANVWGYFAWTLLDNFEWKKGYAERFGLVRVEYETQQRIPKASAHFFTKLAQENVLRVPTGVFQGSQFAPMVPSTDPPPQKPKQTAAGVQQKMEAAKEHLRNVEPLSIAKAQLLLRELSDKYQDPEFQVEMEAAYQRFSEDNSNLNLSKARQALCLPIQSTILPKYGFEASVMGVHKSVMALRAPELTKDLEIQKLSMYTNFLLSELPQLRVREDARRQEQQDQLEVMEALGTVGRPEVPSRRSGAPGGAEEDVLPREAALELLMELVAAYQDRDFQKKLVAAWTEGLRAGRTNTAVSELLGSALVHACGRLNIRPPENPVPGSNADILATLSGKLPPELLMMPDAQFAMTGITTLTRVLPFRLALKGMDENGVRKQS